MNILSFDIEDWYTSYRSSQLPSSDWLKLDSHVVGNTSIILDFLDRFNQKATFYVLGWIVEQHPGLILEIVKRGHELGYHSYDHQVADEQGPERFEEELVRDLGRIEGLTGKCPLHYRAPIFSTGKNSGWIIPLLLRNGIQSSSSYKAFRRFSHTTIPNEPFYFDHHGNKLAEFPLNRLMLPGIYPVYSGSGYFRVLPVLLLKKLFASHPYNLTYFHPRDFDCEVPYTALLPLYRNVMNRTGNSTTMNKLGILFEHYRFITTSEALIQLQSREDVPVIQVLA